ncbi:hypothetical protein PG996_006853 [Apiospora saccharicola]|uniref:Uncharacterized protein n=1 Tax=Apiospora saccharicola TaxID=335842 RepID=A0ABR1V976_9PEZI
MTGGEINWARFESTTTWKSGSVAGKRNNPITGAEEDFKGKLYTWASNICHEDDTSVTVEDLSRFNVETQDALVSEFLGTLRPALRDRVDSLGNRVQEYETEEDPHGVIAEDFLLDGFRVHRRTYPQFDAKTIGAKGYSNWSKAREIQQQAESQASVENLDRDRFIYALAKVLLEDWDALEPKRQYLDKRKSLKGRKADQWGKLTAAVHGRLFRIRDDQEKIYEFWKDFHWSGAKTPPAYMAFHAMATNLYTENAVVKKTGKDKTIENKHNALLVDAKAADLCDYIPDRDIVILRDKNCHLIAGVITRATQRLFPSDPNLTERMDRAARAFAWRYPYVAPDPTRHATTVDLHYVEKPSRDPRSEYCPASKLHRAVCGVEHYGIHTERVASALTNLKFQKFSQAIWGPNRGKGKDPSATPSWRDEFPKLRTGLYGIATKQLRESLVRWDPDLHQENVQVHTSFPQDWQAGTVRDGNDPYSYLAQLVDPLTEGHRDVGDLMHGLAGLVTFGDFNQGGDLVVKELGVRIPFPSGSHCHLRGRELHHAITHYDGGDYGGLRHSLVMTNKESVRRLYYDELQPGVEIFKGVVRRAIASNFMPIPNSGDARLMNALATGNDVEFTQLAFEAQLKHAYNEAEKKKKGSKIRDPLTQLANEAAMEAAGAAEAVRLARKKVRPRAATSSAAADIGVDDEDDEGDDEDEDEDDDQPDDEENDEAVGQSRRRRRKDGRSRSRSPGGPSRAYKQRDDDVEMED